MAKTYKKVSGTWQPIKKIFKKVSGTWHDLKKVYKRVSGVWQVVHSGSTEYTFTSSITATSSTGILLSNYADPASADEFVITINSGITLSGIVGNVGAHGINSTGQNITNCYGQAYGYGGNGGAGGAGGNAIDFTGFSGKIITFINNGTLKGGAGGAGGAGGNAADTGGSGAILATNYGGCGGAGGAGGAWAYNTVGITLQGDTGATGATGATGVGGANAYFRDTLSCFIAGQKVLLADGTYKKIEDIKIGEKLQGAYNDVVEVVFLTRPPLGNRNLYKINNLINTADHPIVNGDRNGFVAVDIDEVEAERGESTVYDDNLNPLTYWYECINRESTNLKNIKIDDTVLTINGKEKVRTIECIDNYAASTQLYSFDTSHSHTFCVDGYFVGGGATDEDFNYTTGKTITGIKSYITKRFEDKTYIEEQA